MGFEDKKMQRQRHKRSKRFVNFETFFFFSSVLASMLLFLGKMRDFSNSTTWVVNIYPDAMLDELKFESLLKNLGFRS